MSYTDKQDRTIEWPNLIYMEEMELFYKVLEHKIRIKGIGFQNKKIIVDCCQIKHIALPKQ